MARSAQVSDDQIRSVLKKYFGYDDTRGIQREAVRRIVSNQDCFVTAPTGFGKSLCFQLPALVNYELNPEKRPVAIICCPLIALLQNQVSDLRAKGIKCEVISSAESNTHNKDVIDKLKARWNPDFSMVYVTAERLTSPAFISTMKAMHKLGRLSLVAIDEAHCISQWGHDFRPAYSKLGIIKETFPTVPVAAFTATATNVVQDHILKSLNIPNAHRVHMSFLRRNIRYECRYTENLDLPLEQDVLKFVKSKYITETKSWQQGIVYAFKTETVDTLAGLLRSNGVPAVGYHGKMTANNRKKALEKFESGEAPIAVASVAFGMGINVAALRWIVHINIPKSLEAFYQESGRAGRDGLRSDSILYFAQSDVERLRFLIRMDRKLTPERKEAAADALEAMENYAVKVRCRRASVLEHFGEQKSPHEICREEWGKGCDVCENAKSVRLKLFGTGRKLNVQRPRSFNRKELTPHAEFMSAKAKARMKAQPNDDIGSFDDDDGESDRLVRQMRAADSAPSLGFTSARALLNQGNSARPSSRGRGSGSVSDSLKGLVERERVANSGPASTARSRISQLLKNNSRKRNSDGGGSSSRKRNRLF